MKFEKGKLADYHWKYNEFLSTHIEKLADAIESKYSKHDVSCLFTHSNCSGLSNYLNISTYEGKNEAFDFTIRISDHSALDTGSNPCDYYLSVIDKEWMDIRKEILSIVASEIEKNLL